MEQFTEFIPIWLQLPLIAILASVVMIQFAVLFSLRKKTKTPIGIPVPPRVVRFTEDMAPLESMIEETFARYFALRILPKYVNPGTRTYSMKDAELSDLVQEMSSEIIAGVSTAYSEEVLEFYFNATAWEEYVVNRVYLMFITEVLQQEKKKMNKNDRISFFMDFANKTPQDFAPESAPRQPDTMVHG
jgi:hypothetical protein